MSRASGIPVNLGKSLEESLTPNGRLSPDAEAAIRGAAQNRSASISLRLVLAELDASRERAATAEAALEAIALKYHRAYDDATPGETYSEILDAAGFGRDWLKQRQTEGRD